MILKLIITSLLAALAAFWIYMLSRHWRKGDPVAGLVLGLVSIFADLGAIAVIGGLV